MWKYLRKPRWLSKVLSRNVLGRTEQNNEYSCVYDYHFLNADMMLHPPSAPPPNPNATTKQSVTCLLLLTMPGSSTAHNTYGISKYVHHLPVSKEDTTMLSISMLGPTWLLNETTHCRRIWYEECTPNGGGEANTKTLLCNFLQKYQHGGRELYDPTVICSIGS